MSLSVRTIGRNGRLLSKEGKSESVRVERVLLVPLTVVIGGRTGHAGSEGLGSERRGVEEKVGSK